MADYDCVYIILFKQFIVKLYKLFRLLRFFLFRVFAILVVVGVSAIILILVFLRRLLFIGIILIPKWIREKGAKYCKITQICSTFSINSNENLREKCFQISFD